MWFSALNFLKLALKILIFGAQLSHRLCSCFYFSNVFWCVMYYFLSNIPNHIDLETTFHFGHFVSFYPILCYFSPGGKQSTVLTRRITRRAHLKINSKKCDFRVQISKITFKNVIFGAQFSHRAFSCFHFLCFMYFILSYSICLFTLILKRRSILYIYFILLYFMLFLS